MDLGTAPDAVAAFERLGGVSVAIQTLEFLQLLPATSSQGVWSWSPQRADLVHATHPTRKIFDLLYSDLGLRVQLWVRLGAAASLLIGSTPWTAALLFLGGVAILIRWRGAFNGGSDFMTLVFATGLLIGNFAAPFVGSELAWKAALWYVCIHALTSYFISGAIKLFAARWRDGRALTHFLDGGLYGPLRADSVFRRRPVAIACSWAFILWECAFPFALTGPAWASVWCAVAGAFHLLVFRYFGLNRFFWAWVTSFPAIIYCSGQW